jgi:hypothetical protein
MFNQINTMMKTLLNLVMVMTLSLPLSSFAQWSSDPMVNTPIDLSQGLQTIPKVAIDHLSGNVYIVYYSFASGNYDVILQYLDHQGYLVWPEPLVVSNHLQDPMLTDIAALTDSEGNCIITFSDLRNGSLDVYVYKISPDGQFLYGEDGIRLSDNPGEEFRPVLCLTTDNSAIVSWIEDNAETGNHLVMASIDVAGNLLWNDGRITWVPDGDYSYANPYLVSTGEGEFIVVFSRNSGPPWSPFRQIYAQRIDFFGDPVWPIDATVNDAGGLNAWDVLNLKADGQGGLYVAWNDDRDGDQVNESMVQHIDANGNLLFITNGLRASTSFAHKCFPVIAGWNDNNDLFVYWVQTKITKGDPALFGQRISADGIRQWTDNGKEIVPHDKGFYVIDGGDVRDNLSYIFYEMYVIDMMDIRIRAKCLDADGNSAWETDQLSISEFKKETYHTVVSDYSDGQWIMAWTDVLDTNIYDLYAQNINEDGSIGNPTGITEQDHQAIDIYPNPCAGSLNINQNGFQELCMLNLAGQVVMEQKIRQGDNIVNVSELNPGIYVLKLSGTKGTIVHRIGIIGY